MERLKKKLEECHFFYVQSHTLLLVDVFQDFRNMCLKTYELDTANFLSATGLTWQTVLKKTKVNLDLLTDIDMLEGIRGGICHSIYRYVKANSKYLKDYNKNKELSYIQYWDVNNLYGWAMSQKPRGFFWVGQRYFSMEWRFHKKL